MNHRFRHDALPAVAVLLLFLAACSTPRPEGVADAKADALAKRMVASVDAEAWRKTGAVTWTFAGRYNHLWDRKRQFVRVQKGDLKVLVNLRSKKGIATDDGVRLEGEDRDEAVTEAYEAWVNDSFWLLAMNKPFDPGTKRFRVSQEDGGEALLVQYSSGGVTPGDAYLWHFDENGRPVSWDMWVSVIPIGGASATWEGWVQLPTGAWVSTKHDAGLMNIEITDLDGAESVHKLVDGSDPFQPLLDSHD